MLLSLYMMLSGGQISVMVTDALEGVISSVFYIIVAIFIVTTLSFSQVRTAFLSGAPGQSYIDPFDIAQQPDFNNYYVILNLLFGIYIFRGGAWQAAFVASARTAHESRMAQILGTWRGFSYGAMATLASIGAFTLLHHPDFAAQQHLVESHLQGIDNAHIQAQMRMPMALGLLLASGIKGAFCAVAIFGILSSQGEQLHRYGSTFLQDVVLPFRKKPFEPHEHIRWLKLSSVGVAIFVCTFSVFYKPADYLVMISALIGVIYLGGIGIVVWGALYWRWATTQGALVSLGFAGFMGIAMNIIQPLWPSMSPYLVHWAGHGPLADYLAANTAKFPLNGLEISVAIALVSAISFVSVSLLTCREPFNLDAMLHRGKYQLASETNLHLRQPRKNWLERFLDFDDNFTRRDRILVYATLGWTLFWQLVTLTIILKSWFIGRFPATWFIDYLIYVTLPVNLVVGVITTIWFLFGVTGDMRSLFSTLKTVQRNDADDGTVRDHHNLGETTASSRPEPAMKS
jgi:SSS family solute:Na+ symporter